MEAIPRVSWVAGTVEAPERVCAMREHVARPILALILVRNFTGTTAETVVTMAQGVKTRTVLTARPIGGDTVFGALELFTQLVGAQIAVGDSVTQAGQLVQLQDVCRLVHLTAEVAVFEVEEENLAPDPEPDASPLSGDVC